MTTKLQQLKKRLIIAVDIDNYITNGEPFWQEEPTPRLDVIEKVNKLYKRGHVIIYHTGRHRNYYAITESWLIKHGCYFHALRMGKISADWYLDDKNGEIDNL